MSAWRSRGFAEKNSASYYLSVTQMRLLTCIHNGLDEREINAMDSLYDCQSHLWSIYQITVLWWKACAYNIHDQSLFRTTEHSRGTNV